MFVDDIRDDDAIDESMECCSQSPAVAAARVCHSSHCSNPAAPSCYGYCSECRLPGRGTNLWLPASRRTANGVRRTVQRAAVNLNALAAAAAAPSVVQYADGANYDADIHNPLPGGDDEHLTWFSIFVTKSNTDIEFIYFYRAAE